MLLCGKRGGAQFTSLACRSHLLHTFQSEKVEGIAKSAMFLVVVQKELAMDERLGLLIAMGALIECVELQ